MFGNRKVDNLSVEELEKLLLIKRRQSRLERFQRLSDEGRSANEALVSQDVGPPIRPVSSLEPQNDSVAAPGFQTAVVQPLGKAKKKQKPDQDHKPQEYNPSRKLRDSLLLGLEVVALMGLVGVLVGSYFNLKELNDEVAIAQQSAVKQQILPTPTATPPISLAARLPGGHSPPTAPGGAVPDVPLHLQEWVQPSPSLSAASVAIPVEQASNAPSRIVIPKITVDAPIVAGVTWEDLKKGVGHLPGSSYPGERGNLYLAAHNDIFGEIFRYLDELEPGDEYFIYGGEQKFTYMVKEKRIIEPNEVEVMWPTTEPVATLQTCYPYLVDTHRLVVISELVK
jgi:sortase A